MHAKIQYGFVQESRKVLFDYCQTISPDDFMNQNSSFGRGGSIRNLLVHIANTYEHWIANIALRNNVAPAEYDSHKNIQDVIDLFDYVDNFMTEFMPLMEKPDSVIEYELNGEKKLAQPFKLFTHVITHEYHHKGQILSISRHLGYIPVDTDIMR